MIDKHLLDIVPLQLPKLTELKSSLIEHVENREKIPYGYFTYSPSHGYEQFEKEEDAIKYCNEMIESFKDTDGWDDNVKGVCYGEITHMAKLEVEKSDDPDYEDSHYFVLKARKEGV